MHRSQRRVGPGTHFCRANSGRNCLNMRLGGGTTARLTTFLALRPRKALVNLDKRVQDLAHPPASQASSPGTHGCRRGGRDLTQKWRRGVLKGSDWFLHANLGPRRDAPGKRQVWAKLSPNPTAGQPIVIVDVRAYTTMLCGVYWADSFLKRLHSHRSTEAPFCVSVRNSEFDWLRIPRSTRRISTAAHGHGRLPGDGVLLPIDEFT